jgi:hypothetical protein
MATMTAFHGDKAIKERYLDRIKSHREADELIKGKYWENGKGCAVGCTIHGSSHSAYEIELGIPIQLARLEDVHFERLSNDDSQAWPELFLSSIRVGADLSMVWPKYAAWMLDGLPKQSNPKIKTAIEGVKWLYTQWTNTGIKPAAEKWIHAAADADAAAADAAYAAAAAAATYAAYAAYAAAADAADAAADAADAAAAAAAYADAAAADGRSKWWKKSAAKLIELLKAA